MMTLTLANLAMDKSIFEFESCFKKTIDDDSVFRCVRRRNKRGGAKA